jgi:hypothetical protein
MGSIFTAELSGTGQPQTELERDTAMTVITDVPSALAAGVSAAELAAMQDAASAFRDQFAGGQGRHEPVYAGGVRIYRSLSAADLFGALMEPFSPPPQANRCACYMDRQAPHYYVPHLARGAARD